MDGVYSQDGDFGLVGPYLRTAEKHGAMLIVDDAHGIGVLGETGAGLLEEKGLLGEVPLVVGSLSKAFGAIGGFVSGRKELISYIRYHAASCCLSASLPPSCLAASLKSLELIQAYRRERKELLDNSQYARTKLREAGFTLTDSASPIIGIMAPTFDDAILWAKRLLKHDIYIAPIGYPAVPKRFPRLRLALSGKHTHRDIGLLVEKLLLVSQKDYQYMERRKRRSAAEIVKLIDQATEEIVREKGFEGLGIQEICDRAEIEPALFYRRYPEGLAYYTEQFIRNHDFWLISYNDSTVAELRGTREELTKIFISLWEKVTSDTFFSSFLRLELQRNIPEAAREMAKVREENTQKLVGLFATDGDVSLTKRIQLALITAGLQYLALHKDVSTFCGVDFNSIETKDLQAALSGLSGYMTEGM